MIKYPEVSQIAHPISDIHESQYNKIISKRRKDGSSVKFIIRLN